jgi:hypothetical protein
MKRSKTFDVSFVHRLTEVDQSEPNSSPELHVVGSDVDARLWVKIRV